MNGYTIRCPYCVEGDNFKPMRERAEGEWFICPHCGHVIMNQRPSYRCNCEHCAKKPLPN